MRHRRKLDARARGGARRSGGVARAIRQQRAGGASHPAAVRRNPERREPPSRTVDERHANQERVALGRVAIADRQRFRMLCLLVAPQPPVGIRVVVGRIACLLARVRCMRCRRRLCARPSRHFAFSFAGPVSRGASGMFLSCLCGSRSNVMNRRPALILLLGCVLLPHEEFLRVRRYLRRRARDDAVLGYVAPVALTKALQPLEEAAVLLL